MSYRRDEDRQDAGAALVAALPLGPFTFEESLIQWAETLETDVRHARQRRRGVVGLDTDQMASIARYLRGAARLIEQAHGGRP